MTTDNSKVKFEKFKQQARLFNLTDDELKFDFENINKKKIKYKKKNIFSRNIKLSEYKNLISNCLIKNTDKEVKKGFECLKINFAYKSLKIKLKKSQKDRKYELSKYYQKEIFKLLNPEKSKENAKD